MNIEKEITAGMPIKNPYLESKSVCDTLSEYPNPSPILMLTMKTIRSIVRRTVFRLRINLYCLLAF